MLEWVMESGACAWMMPPPFGEVDAYRLVQRIDGMILHGGVDIAPEGYGEKPLQAAWAGDAQRDAIETALLRACMTLNKPVLGVCRGHQLINVAMGGSLYQDVVSQGASSSVHRDADVYDALHHEVDLLAQGSWLQEIYPGVTRGCVNSVHHQALKTLGKGLVVQALGQGDGVVESVCLEGYGDVEKPYVAGVQWHPEFKVASEGRRVLDDVALRNHFLDACLKRKEACL